MVELEGSSCSGTDQRGLVWMVLCQHGSCSVPGSPCPTRFHRPGKGWKGLLSRPCRLGMKVVEEGAGRELREALSIRSGRQAQRGPCQSKLP